MAVALNIVQCHCHYTIGLDELSEHPLVCLCAVKQVLALWAVGEIYALPFACAACVVSAMHNCTMTVC